MTERFHPEKMSLGQNLER